MKRFFAAFAFTCMAILASAQTSFGIHAGAAINNVTSLNGFDFKNMTGLTLGAMLDYQTCDLLDLQAELNFSQRGYKCDVYEDDSDFQAEFKIKSSYLELPVIAKLYPFSRIGFNIQAGPQISLLLDRSFSQKNGNLKEEYVKGKDNNVDCGLNFGMGYVQNGWTLDLRYYLGLLKSYKDWTGYKNRGVSLTVGYYFN